MTLLVINGNVRSIWKKWRLKTGYDCDCQKDVKYGNMCDIGNWYRPIVLQVLEGCMLNISNKANKANMLE